MVEESRPDLYEGVFVRNFNKLGDCMELLEPLWVNDFIKEYLVSWEL
jgi:hypothetical protein